MADSGPADGCSETEKSLWQRMWKKNEKISAIPVNGDVNCNGSSFF